MSSERADITEDQLHADWPGVLELLLLDHSDVAKGEEKPKRGSTHNILWATVGYVAEDGDNYRQTEQIEIPYITGEHGHLIVPRVYKESGNQTSRTKDKAEVFTPGWVVNAQNNLVDDAWFERSGVFNTTSEDQRTITPSPSPIEFPDEDDPELSKRKRAKLKTWQNYIRRTWLESACGEAPYVVSRYDAATGKSIPIEERFGALDRKLRIIRENIGEDEDEETWFSWVLEAYKSVYGYEWQGDSLLVARENLLFTFFDVYRVRYDRDPDLEQVLAITEVISWNFFQMDGLKYVMPETCHEENENPQFDDWLFEPPEKVECQGCAKNNPQAHTGRYARIMDWKTKRSTRFVDMLKAQEKEKKATKKKT